MKPPALVLIFVGFPFVAHAEVCADIKDDAERLACYDARDRAAPGSLEKTADAVQAPDVPSAESAPAAPSATQPSAPENSQDFGKRETPERDKPSIEATIIEVVTAGDIDYLRLDNGQVWREVENSNMRFKVGRRVTVTEGILNSYDLRMEGFNKVVKVRRTQ